MDAAADLGGRIIRFGGRRRCGAVCTSAGWTLRVLAFAVHDENEIGVVRTLGVANSRPTIALANR